MTNEELALVTRLEGYRTTCCDDSRAVPDLIAIIRRLESELAELKAGNDLLREEFNASFRRGAVEALEKAYRIVQDYSHPEALRRLDLLRDSYQSHKGEE